MKKYLVILLAVLILCGMTPVFAFNWANAATEKCTEYTLTADKYIKVEGDVGSAYEKAPAATAKVGDTVYFALSAVDTSGEKVDFEIEYHNLGNIEEVGTTLLKAKVVGPKPYVKISITEKTSIDELTYKNIPIEVDEDIVIIDNLIFLRAVDGTVTDVDHFENTNEMLKDLAALGISIDDIYNGKICMTDDVLIANFGKVCNTEAVAAWYVPTENEELGIPKTGDMTVTGIVILAVCLSGAVMLIRKGMHCKR